MHSFSTSFVLLHLIRQNTKRLFTTKNIQQCQPTQELDQLYRLATLINGTQSNIEKADQLLKYPACHDILRRIYDPHLRHYVSSKSILAHVRLLQQQQQQSTNEQPQEPPINSLKELLDALSSRRLSGKAALNATASFYSTYCKTDQQKQIFCRILDRNLKMGMSVITIQRLLQQQEKRKDNDNNDHNPQDHHDHSHPKDIPLSFKSVALASTAPWKPPQPASSKEQQQNQEDEWYASRKLDGVRCIAYVQSPELITFYSRTGRVFHALQKVKEAIQTRLLSMKEHSATTGDEIEMSPFVLDGEICVYSQEGMDDFLMALRQIRSLQQPMTNPVYELFDMINVQGFRQGKDSTRFMDRQQNLAQFIQSPQAHLRMVKQIKIDTEEQLETLKSKAIEKGWEGLILRKNVAYEGKRR